MASMRSRAAVPHLVVLASLSACAAPTDPQSSGDQESGIPTTTANPNTGEGTADATGGTGPSRADTTGTTSTSTTGVITSSTTAIAEETSGETQDIPSIRFDLAPPPDLALEDTGDCGGALFGSMPIPPNMLIVLDRSLSMTEDLDGVLGGTPSKWEIATAAIDEVTVAFSEQIRFGLMMFPGASEECGLDDPCDAGGVFIDPAPETAEAISTQIDFSGACALGTPIGETITALNGYQGLQDPDRDNFVLMLTDGQPMECTDHDLEVAVAQLRAQPEDVRTFVVGFGSGVNPTQLAAMAMAGGTARDTDPVYYQADDATALQEAFADIAGSIVSCDFLLAEVPPDPADLYAFFDAELVERDPTRTDGWDYDATSNQVTFYGSACAALQANEVDAVDIVFGCPVIPEK